MENQITNLLAKSLLFDREIKDKILATYPQLSKVQQVLLMSVIEQADSYQNLLLQGAINNNDNITEDIKSHKNNILKNNMNLEKIKEVELLDLQIDNILNNA